MVNVVLESENFKGIRDLSHGDYLVADDFRRGFSFLRKYGLISSIAVQWQDMDKLADLARTYSDTTMVLDHAGFPQERTPEFYFPRPSGRYGTLRLVGDTTSWRMLQFRKKTGWRSTHFRGLLRC